MAKGEIALTRFDYSAPRVTPADQFQAHLKGKFFVARGMASASLFLQRDGKWTNIPHYFVDRDAAEQALLQFGDLPPPLESNVVADIAEARAAKAAFRH